MSSCVDRRSIVTPQQSWRTSLGCTSSLPGIAITLRATVMFVVAVKIRTNILATRGQEMDAQPPIYIHAWHPLQSSIHVEPPANAYRFPSSKTHMHHPCHPCRPGAGVIADHLRNTSGEQAIPMSRIGIRPATLPEQTVSMIDSRRRTTSRLTPAARHGRCIDPRWIEIEDAGVNAGNIRVSGRHTRHAAHGLHMESLGASGRDGHARTTE